MKVVIVLMVLIAGGIGAVYYFGGYSSFDPDKQGREAKAAIKPGMSWTQVIQVAGDNPKIQTISVSRRKIAGQMTEERLVSPPNEFNKDRVADAIKTGRYSFGFILNYFFSEQVAFSVEFDGRGVALSVEDTPTMADLLGTRKQDEEEAE